MFKSETSILNIKINLNFKICINLARQNCINFSKRDINIFSYSSILRTIARPERYSIALEHSGRGSFLLNKCGIKGCKCIYN